MIICINLFISNIIIIFIIYLFSTCNMFNLFSMYYNLFIFLFLLIMTTHYHLNYNNLQWIFSYVLKPDYSSANPRVRILRSNMLQTHNVWISKNLLSMYNTWEYCTNVYTCKRIPSHHPYPEQLQQKLNVTAKKEKIMRTIILKFPSCLVAGAVRIVEEALLLPIVAIFSMHVEHSRVLRESAYLTRWLLTRPKLSIAGRPRVVKYDTPGLARAW